MNIYLLGDKSVPPALNLPMLEIQYLSPSIDLELYDALIFTSKNGIFGIDNITSLWKEKNSYAIALQTAKIIDECNGKLAFIGEKGHGDAFAKELIPHLKNKKALYIRGKEVVSNLVTILKENDIVCDELIVYETICKKYENKQSLPKDSIIIFSSPSTIKCFLENYSWDENFRAIAIGNTTAKYFPPHIKPIISDFTSLESCVKKAIEVLS